jgi:hypothetical protein
MGSWWWVSCELKFSVVVFGWKSWVWGGTALWKIVWQAGLPQKKHSQWSSMQQHAL